MAKSINKFKIIKPILIYPLLIYIALRLLYYAYQNSYESFIEDNFLIGAAMMKPMIEILQFMFTPKFWVLYLVVIAFGLLVIFITNRNKGERFFKFILRHFGYEEEGERNE